jgi:hypothetical protein
MTDPLSDVFRANVLRIRDARGLNDFQLGKIVTPHHPAQARTQLVERAGRYSVTLATVGQYADRLGVPVVDLLRDVEQEADCA